MKPGSHDNDHLDHDLEQVAAAYRDTPPDEPPTLLDQAILNRARGAVESRSVRPWNFGWIHAVTTTAVLVLAVAIVMQLPEDPAMPQEPAAPQKSSAMEEFNGYRASGEGKDKAAIDDLLDSDETPVMEQEVLKREAATKPAHSDASRNAPEDPDPGQRAPDGKTDLESAPEPDTGLPVSSGDLGASGRARDAAEDRRYDEPARRQARTEADEALADELAGQELQERMEPQEEVAAPAAITLEQAANEAFAATPEAPEAWLERILELQAAGEEAAARAELEAFRAVWPDYELPPQIAGLLPEAED